MTCSLVARRGSRTRSRTIRSRAELPTDLVLQHQVPFVPSFRRNCMRVRAHVWSFSDSEVHRVQMSLCSSKFLENTGERARSRVPYFDLRVLKYGTRRSHPTPCSAS